MLGLGYVIFFGIIIVIIIVTLNRLGIYCIYFFGIYCFPILSF